MNEENKPKTKRKYEKKIKKIIIIYKPITLYFN